MLSKIAPFAGLYTLGTRGHWRNARAKHTRTTQTSPYTHALHGIKSTHPECNNLDLVYIYQRAYLCVRSLSLSFLFSCSGSAITGCLLVCTWECAMASTIRWWRCGWERWRSGGRVSEYVRFGFSATVHRDHFQVWDRWRRFDERPNWLFIWRCASWHNDIWDIWRIKQWMMYTNSVFIYF